MSHKKSKLSVYFQIQRDFIRDRRNRIKVECVGTEVIRVRQK